MRDVNDGWVEVLPQFTNQATKGRNIYLSNQVHDTLKKFGMEKVKPIKKPMTTNGHLGPSKELFDI
jgi:hypothetical protein